jgi:hypothetical protein
LLLALSTERTINLADSSNATRERDLGPATRFNQNGDEIGEVLDLDQKTFESPPETLQGDMRELISTR